MVINQAMKRLFATFGTALLLVHCGDLSDEGASQSMDPEWAATAQILSDYDDARDDTKVVSGHPRAAAPDVQSGVPFFGCPNGTVVEFNAEAQSLTSDQWRIEIDHAGPTYCSGYTCSNCGDVDTAYCQYSHNEVVKIGDEGRTVFAKMYCYCPLY